MNAILILMVEFHARFAYCLGRKTTGDAFRIWILSPSCDMRTRMINLRLLRSMYNARAVFMMPHFRTTVHYENRKLQQQ